MTKIMQATASILLLLVYFIYLRQIRKGKSTPNPGTWITWFAIMGINAVTYLKVVDGDYYKAASTFVALASMTMIMTYSLIKGKFAKLAAIDIVLLILSASIGVLWLTTANAKLSTCFLQIVIFVSFLPTAIGLVQNRLKEFHLSWTLATLAYVIQTASLLINYDGNIYQLFLPIINGILGNGMVAVIILYKNIKT